MATLLITLCFFFTDKPKEPKKDTFAEKMAAQIIKNLQIKVTNVHVRYEDKYSNPKRPFSIGITLKELLFQVNLCLFVCLMVFSTTFNNTVKPVLRGHLWDKEKVAL